MESLQWLDQAHHGMMVMSRQGVTSMMAYHWDYWTNNSASLPNYDTMKARVDSSGIPIGGENASKTT